jgi:carboxyl-terminal processing protease
MLRRLSISVVGFGFVLGMIDARAADKPAAPKASATATKADDKASEKDAKVDEEYYELYRVFAETMFQVEQNYVKDVDRRKLMEAAIRGLLDELDPYSNYISPDEIDRFKTSVESQFGGIGIQVSSDRGFLKVISPLVGSPAYEAGIEAGDVIVEIDGKSTEGITLDESVKRMKGEPGTDVKLTLVRARDRKRETMTLQREIIEVETVLGDNRDDTDQWNFMLDADKKIGYVRLTSFSRNTADDLEKALRKLKKDGMKGLVLDLRFNPGGLLKSAIDVSDLFIAEGKIVSTKGRNTAERPVTARKAGTYEGFPIAVLVNRYSASASEIVSACLQDHKRAIVVGERTWGKGSVQNVIEMEEGNSALKLTTAAYIRPSGENIHKFPDAKESDVWGVMPDKGFDLKLNDEELGELMRVRRERDLLLVSHSPGVKRGPTKIDANDDEQAKPTDGKPSKSSTDKTRAKLPKSDAPGAKPGAKSPSDPVEASKFVDRQLQKAIDYVTSEAGAEQAKAGE